MSELLIAVGIALGSYLFGQWIRYRIETGYWFGDATYSGRVVPPPPRPGYHWYRGRQVRNGSITEDNQNEDRALRWTDETPKSISEGGRND